MDINIKIERALKALPMEVIIQYSSQTDNVNVLKENAIREAEEEGKTLLEVLHAYAVETLETYDSELLGHLNYFMQFEENEKGTWKEERAEIVRYIKKLESYLKK